MIGRFRRGVHVYPETELSAQLKTVEMDLRSSAVDSTLREQLRSAYAAVCPMDCRWTVWTEPERAWDLIWETPTSVWDPPGLIQDFGRPFTLQSVRLRK